MSHHCCGYGAVRRLWRFHALDRVGTHFVGIGMYFVHDRGRHLAWIAAAIVFATMAPQYAYSQSGGYGGQMSGGSVAPGGTFGNPGATGTPAYGIPSIATGGGGGGGAGAAGGMSA